MANQQHIDWLLEGVDAWNGRRDQDDFTPDFSDTSIQKYLTEAGMVSINNIPDLTGVNLKKANFDSADLEIINFRKALFIGANFRKASLRGAYFQKVDLTRTSFEKANLTGAFLTEAILTKANLENADLTDVKLTGANLTRAKLTGAILTKAGLRGAKVKTIISGSGMNSTANAQFTDLSQCVGFTQAQLETMDGDTGVILPEGWKHPAHWPKWDDGENLQKENKITIAENELPIPPTPVQASTALKNQVRFVLETAPAAQDGANLASIQITAAIGKFITETGLNTSDEIEIFTDISKIFDQLANALDINRNDAAKIQELEAIITSQKVELERLTRLLENKPSLYSQIMVGALSGAGASALTGTPAYFFGPEGVEIITNITNYFAINPAPIPPSLTVG